MKIIKQYFPVNNGHPKHYAKDREGGGGKQDKRIPFKMNIL